MTPLVLFSSIASEKAYVEIRNFRVSNDDSFFVSTTAAVTVTVIGAGSNSVIAFNQVQFKTILILILTPLISHESVKNLHRICLFTVKKQM